MTEDNPVRLRLVSAITGASLVVAGVAFIFWPLAVVLAGAALIAFGLLTDDGGTA